MKKLLLSLALITSGLVGCEKTDDDKISKAQKCLDEALVDTDAAACEAMIVGISNEKANRIRCSLSVLASGTTQAEIISAFETMDSGGQDPVIEVATVLGVGDQDSSGTVDAADEAVAVNIKNVCYTSESKGLRTVAQLILFGTRAQVAAELLGDPEDPEDVADNIATMDPEDAGAFANDVFDLYCVPEFSNTDICETLSSAGAGSGDNATVGAALQACLAANNCN